MAVAILDTLIPVETPEGILLEMRPAGLCVRFYAFLVDMAVRLVVICVAAMAFSFIGGIGFAFWMILAFALEWLYPVAFELGLDGATPGKRALRLKVVMDDGLPVTPAASLTRNLLRFADFLPFLYAFAIVSMLTRKDCKRLGDIAAATLVVHQARPPERLTLPDVKPIAPVGPLSKEDQAALIAFAARAPRLTVERLDELAALAARVSGDAGLSGAAVTRHVLGVAQWLLGRR